MKQKFEFPEKSLRLQEIKDVSFRILDSDDSYVELGKKIRSELDEVQKETKLTVAFVGQYSAGKSTIISALTGNNHIKIDSDIATDTTSEYEWNDVVLIDTPGLYTGRKDHDRITEEKIKKADILVFCLTYSLFDNILLDNFLNLAFERGYVSKMLLVVNKMYSEEGEYNELVHNYRFSLQKQLGSSHSLDIFPTSFIAAQFQRDEDHEIQELSHFGDLIANLNSFITNKGALSKITTPAHILIDNMERGIIDVNFSEDKLFFDLLSRAEREIKKIKVSSEYFFRNEINSLKSRIQRRGIECATMVGGADVSEIENRIKSSSDEISMWCDEISKQIQIRLEAYEEQLIDELAKISKSETASICFKDVSGENILYNAKNRSATIGSEQINSLKNILGAGSKLVGNAANGVKAGSGLLTPTGAAGSQLHSAVLSVGKFFGVTFKPWGAVNIAKNIGNVAKVLGPVTAFLGIAMEVMDAQKEKDAERLIKNAQIEIKKLFNDNAETVVSQFKENFGNVQQALFEAKLYEISQLRKSKISSTKKLSDTAKKLKRQIDLLKELVK